MMEEILAGLKNAIERGYSLEQAAQSFLNAGYNPREIEEAVNSITHGAIYITQSQEPIQKSLQSVQPNSFQPIQNKRKKTSFILLLFALLILIIAIILILIFNNSIINFINNIFS